METLGLAVAQNLYSTLLFGPSAHLFAVEFLLAWASHWAYLYVCPGTLCVIVWGTCIGKVLNKIHYFWRVMLSHAICLACHISVYAFISFFDPTRPSSSDINKTTRKSLKFKRSQGIWSQKKPPQTNKRIKNNIISFAKHIILKYFPIWKFTFWKMSPILHLMIF